MSKQSETTLPWIDALRVIAIIAVIGFHVAYEFNPSSTLRPIGFFGVSLFFIISGFVLANRYQNVSIFDFSWYTKRWLKLASLYYPTLVVLIVLFSTKTIQQNLYDLFMHFVFLDFLSADTIYSIISPAWFIVPLVGLYALFPFLNLILKKHPEFIIPFSSISFMLRFLEGNFTSFSPLYFLSDFCFGIIFAQVFIPTFDPAKTRKCWLLPSLVTGFITPVMALSYPLFYVFSKLKIPSFLLPAISFIATHTFELFLFHESILQVLLGKWHILGQEKVLSLVILGISLFYVTKLAEKVHRFKIS